MSSHVENLDSINDYFANVKNNQPDDELELKDDYEKFSFINKKNKYKKI